MTILAGSIMKKIIVSLFLLPVSVYPSVCMPILLSVSFSLTDSFTNIFTYSTIHTLGRPCVPVPSPPIPASPSEGAWRARRPPGDASRNNNVAWVAPSPPPKARGQISARVALAASSVNRTPLTVRRRSCQRQWQLFPLLLLSHLLFFHFLLITHFFFSSSR